MKTPISSLMLLLLSISLSAAGQVRGVLVAGPTSFQLSSTTFANETTLPISMIDNIIVNGSNACSIDGSPGGNQSPELSWTNVPPHTASFVVTVYDTTASFTHWGMYNIPATATGLLENAGVAGSADGSQIVNDFGLPEYDGPCPPANVRPFVHDYVFTVYALNTTLKLTGTANFPNNAETLYQALLHAAKNGNIVGSASMTGLYSTTP
ncbi:MAG: YbhB/YbcL family Raf kinase inhibitor-like protein [Terriglobales bacterium]